MAGQPHIINRVCTKCEQGKPLSDFNADKKGAAGRSARCRECTKAYKAGYRKAHRDKFLAGMREWRLANLEDVRAKDRERNQLRSKENAQRSRAWRQANTERFDANAAKWKALNRDKVRAAQRRYDARIRATPKGRLENTISSGVRKALCPGSKAGRATFDLLGYTPDALMRHLEGLFLEGMTWANYGDWHIDHRVPLSAFNYETPDHADFRRAWALSNLQPLWARDNLSKGARIDAPFQPSLAI